MGRRPRVTREVVLKAAREAFAERGYEGTTLAAISGRVGLSPAALLRHAPSKEALFAAAMAPEGAEGESLPMEFLGTVPGTADPKTVLRRMAEAFVPFFERKIGADLVRFLHAPPLGNPGGCDPADLAKTRRKGLTIVADYMRRASRAGRLDIRDPEAAAMAFMGSLVSYVFLHRVARIFDPPLPLDRYLDDLMAIWTRGAIRTPNRKS
jgi:AcrR family transcriptional regulator